MALPTYQQLMLPVLKLIRDGRRTIPECIPYLIAEFFLTPEEIEELLPSGKQTVLSNRAHWARNYMSQAGLVVSIRRGHYELTEAGKALLAQNPTAITTATLKNYEAFRLWIGKSAGPSGDSEASPLEIAAPAGTTPEASMEVAHRLLDAALRDELLTILQEVSPQKFERLILDLLTAMGYGQGNLTNSHMTKASSDGGIDGIIHEDALGLDAVYIQAKRYAPENKVSRPAIQQFVGSLTGEGAIKGVFVTTSDFSAEAKNYLGKVQHRIVLINGQELGRLMIKYGVGVRARFTYVIKGVDEDYFSELNGS